MDSPFKGPRITIEQLRGLNERQQFANVDLGAMDYLKGVIPTTFNTLTRPGAIALLQTISPSEMVLQICQTNDSNGNIIVQTDKAIRIMNEEEFFGSIYVPNFVNVPVQDDEIMPRAILVHTAVSGGLGGGNLTTSSAQMPITSILSQVNADGTAAAFCSLAANQFTLSAGVYYVKGYHNLFNVAAKVAIGQLYNITAAANAWAGLNNENTNKVVFDGANNQVINFEGILQPNVPTTYEWRAVTNTLRSNDGLGKTTNTAPANTIETYGILDIIKTA